MSFVADVFEAVCIDNVTGETVATSTLQEAGIEVAVKESEIRGGRGNGLQVVLHSDRDITINMKDSHFRYDFMAKNLGQSIVTGAGIGYAMPKFYTVVDTAGTLKFTLDHVPVSLSDHGVKLFKEDGTPITTFTVAAAGVVTVTGSTVLGGEQVEVKTFKYATPATTQTLVFDNSTYASGMTVILETLEIDENANPIFTKQYHFYNAIPTGNFSVSTAAERAGVSPEFSLKVVKPKNSTVVGKLIRIPYTA